MNVPGGPYSADEGDATSTERVSASGPKRCHCSRHWYGSPHLCWLRTSTVTENIVLGNEVTKAGGVLDPKRASREGPEIVEEYGFDG